MRFGFASLSRGASNNRNHIQAQWTEGIPMMTRKMTRNQHLKTSAIGTSLHENCLSFASYFLFLVLHQSGSIRPIWGQAVQSHHADCIRILHDTTFCGDSVGSLLFAELMRQKSAISFHLPRKLCASFCFLPKTRSCRTRRSIFALLFCSTHHP